MPIHNADIAAFFDRLTELLEAFGVRTLGEVRRAAERHEIRRLPGFGDRLESKILAELARLLGRG